MLTSACLALLLLAAPGLELPSGSPVELDGRIEKGEWDDARKLAGERHTCLLKRTGPWLALGVVGSRPYDGEKMTLFVSEPGGAWQCALTLSLGRITQPPALWVRATQEGVRLAFGDRRMPLQTPRAALCRLWFEQDSWSAEYRIRLGALGIGRADRRPFRIRLVVSSGRSGGEPGLVFPEGSSDRTPAAGHAVLSSPDRWGANERWAPVTPQESLEFDDNERLAVLAMEQVGMADRELVDQLIISSAVRPRSAERIEALRKALEAGRARNPGLPAWSFYLGRLLHEANRYDEAARFIDSFPAPLRHSAAYLQLAGEHYIDTEQPDKALELAKANPRSPGMGEIFHMATSLQSMLAAEAKKAAADAELPVVRFETAKGSFEVELFEADARNAVLNFMDLVLRQKYYDKMRFGRVFGAFMAESGDPRSRTRAKEGADGPPWGVRPDDSTRPPLRGRLLTIPLETGVQHGSRFVIALAPMMHRIGKAAVFGRVTKGLDVVLSLEQDDLIKSVTVVRSKDHPYDPKSARVQ